MSETNRFNMSAQAAGELAKLLGGRVVQPGDVSGGPFTFPGSTYIDVAGVRVPAYTVQKELDSLRKQAERAQRDYELNVRSNKNASTIMKPRDPVEALKDWLASGGYQGGRNAAEFLLEASPRPAVPKAPDDSIVPPSGDLVFGGVNRKPPVWWESPGDPWIEKDPTPPRQPTNPRSPGSRNPPPRKTIPPDGLGVAPLPYFPSTPAQPPEDIPYGGARRKPSPRIPEKPRVPSLSGLPQSNGSTNAALNMTSGIADARKSGSNRLGTLLNLISLYNMFSRR